MIKNGLESMSRVTAEGFDTQSADLRALDDLHDFVAAAELNWKWDYDFCFYFFLLKMEVSLHFY